MTDDIMLQRITVNPAVMVGKPTIRGMRITVEHILNAMAHGVGAADLLKEYPELEEADIHAALLYDTHLV